MTPRRNEWSTRFPSLTPFLFFFACVSVVLAAQEPLASLSGVITDASGAVVPNARVTVVNEQTTGTRTTVSDTTGSYRFSNLEPGKYDIRVEFAGFAAIKASGMNIYAAQALRADFALRVGGDEGAAAPPPPETGTAVTSRDFLKSNEQEETGFGLYSYILFGEPANDATRDRYIATLQSFLNLPESREMMKSISPKQLNVTFVPVKPNAVLSTADGVLRDYDFARAAGLLAKLSCVNGQNPCGPHLGGPYIISTTSRLSQQASVSDHLLYQDLSSVPARIVPLWVDEFLRQSSQAEFWKKRNGPQIALKLRTAIAVLGDSLSPTEVAAGDWKKAVASMISWH